jgi:hypothetical protein
VIVLVIKSDACFNSDAYPTAVKFVFRILNLYFAKLTIINKSTAFSEMRQSYLEWDLRNYRLLTLFSSRFISSRCYDFVQFSWTTSRAKFTSSYHFLDSFNVFGRRISIQLERSIEFLVSLYVLKVSDILMLLSFCAIFMDYIKGEVLLLIFLSWFTQCVQQAYPGSA